MYEYVNQTKYFLREYLHFILIYCIYYIFKQLKIPQTIV